MDAKLTSKDKPHPAVGFETVFERELEQIASRSRTPWCAECENYHLTGICFSGGGIRSATFGLGVVQALAKAKLLERFDYVSSVSGGGYLAGWLGAWISRADKEIKARGNGAPGGEDGVRAVQRLLGKGQVGGAEPDEVRFLRRYSNYLTPRVGAFSGDTWALIAIYARNLLLNLSILVVSLATLLLIPRAVLSVFMQGVPETVESRSRLFGIAFLCLVSAIVVMGINLGWFSQTDATREPAESRKRRKRSCREKLYLFLPSPTAIGLFVVLPLLLFAVVVTAYLYIRDEAGVSLGMWVTIDAIVHLVCWVAGYVVMKVIGGLKPRASSPARPEERWRRFWLGVRLVLIITAAALISGAVAGCGLYGLWHLTHLLKFSPGGTLRPGGAWHVAALIPPLVLGVILTGWVALIGMVGAELEDTKREWIGRLGGVLLLVALLWLVLFGVAIHLPVAIRAAWDLHWIQGLWGRVFTLSTVTSWLGITSGGLWLGTKDIPLDKAPAKKTKGRAQGSRNGKTKPSKLDLAGVSQRLILKAAPYVFVAGLLTLLSLGVDWMVPKLLSFFANEPATAGQTHIAATTDTSSVRATADRGLVAANSSPSNRATAAQAPARPATSGAFAVAVDRRFSMLDGTFDWMLVVWVVIGAVVAGSLAFRVDINEFSMHNLYRNRLIRCYLGASNRKRRPHPFTGFDPSDEVDLADLAPFEQHSGPYHIFNTSLNLVRGKELAWQKRRASSFVMTPLYCGYDRSHRSHPSNLDQSAYVPTKEFAAKAGPFGVGTSIAISGAAASPNMGYYSWAPLAFLMTVFNVRLGWWLPNPRHRKRRGSRGPWFGLLYLFLELLGWTNDERGFVYVSDGGHFENLGLYELVRRRCRTIVVCDASCDGEYGYADLVNAIQLCRVDLGAEIVLPIDRVSTKQSAGKIAPACTKGTIEYSDGSTGTIIYLKPHLTGLNQLQPDVRWYIERVDDQFPHQSTTDQWFDECQFESYRALGHRIATDSLAEIKPALVFSCTPLTAATARPATTRPLEDQTG